MLQSMGSQKVRHDLVTEQQQQVIKFYLFLAVLGLHCCSGFSLVLESVGFSLAVARSLLVVAASHGAWALGCMGSLWIRDQTCVSCIDRQIIYLYATRRAPVNVLWMKIQLTLEYCVSQGCSSSVESVINIQLYNWPLYLQLVFVNSTTFRSDGTVIVFSEKNSRTGEPAQFKLMLFKNQLCFL